MSFLDFLSPLVTAATQQAGNYENAQASAKVLQRENVVQALELARQEHLDSIDNALKLAQSREAIGRGDMAERTANEPHVGDKNYADTMAAIEGAKAGATLPFQEKLAELTGGIAGKNSLRTMEQEGANEANVANITQGGANSRQGIQNLFATDELNQNLAGQLKNKTAETAQVQGGQIIPSIMSLFHGATSGPTSLGVTDPVAPTAPVAPKSLFGDLPTTVPNTVPLPPI